MSAGHLLSAKGHGFGALIQTVNLRCGQATFFRQKAGHLRLTAAKLKEFMFGPTLGNQVGQQKPMPWAKRVSDVPIVMIIIPGCVLG